VDEIAEAALRRVPDLLDCVRADVMRYDLDAGEMTLLAVHATGETRVGKHWRGSIDGEWADVLQDLAQGASYTIEDVQGTPPGSPWREALQSEGVHALVALPLLIEGRLIGSLDLGMRRPGQLSAGQMEIAGELAIQLAIGIRQAELHAQVQRHADQLDEQVRRRTAALQASQARLRAIFDSAAVGIVLADLEGHMIEFNPGLQEMLGYSAEELASKHFTEITHPSDVEADEALFQELLLGQRESYSLSKRYVRKDGSYMWGNLHVSLICDPQDEPVFSVALVEDVTERREAQQALIRSEKLALTGRLAASLAHEINNPLQSVIGSLDLADESLEEGKIGDARCMLEVGAEELQRAAGIVTQLRDMNRPSELGTRELTDVRDLLERVLLLTRRQYHSRRVEVVWEPGRDLPWLHAAPDQIKQVFLNLVLNAVEAMPDGGQLSVQAVSTQEPEGVRISFHDTGRGIPPEGLAKLFDPFYTTKDEGLGLGLYVSRSIVDAHGGRIDVESQAGEGTTFDVWLPVEGG
jgi:PAS domain S-box-containing protein